MGISLLLYSIHRLHSLKKSIAPPPDKSDYTDELSNQLNTAVISYASVCALQMGAFCILQKIFQRNFAFVRRLKKSSVLSREKGRYYRLSAERR